jgi:hypothetical protein
MGAVDWVWVCWDASNAAENNPRATHAPPVRPRNLFRANLPKWSKRNGAKNRALGHKVDNRLGDEWIAA